jgi:RNA polymerase sigma factor (sigma-70 family)
MTAPPAYPPLDRSHRMSMDDHADAAQAALVATLDYAYRAFAPGVLGYFRSHGMADAEDLVGEVFLSVARSLWRFRGDPDDLRRWVFAIARRRRADHIRRLIVRRRIIPRDPSEQSVTVPNEDFDIGLVDALSRLTRAQREVVVLRFIADLSIDDVARILHRSTSAIKALQTRALTQLAGRLRDS